jgi:hypothetical protein
MIVNTKILEEDNGVAAGKSRLKKLHSQKVLKPTEAVG